MTRISPFEAMARLVLGADYDARAVAMLAEKTRDEIAALPSLDQDHFDALFGVGIDFHERAPVRSYLDPDSSERRFAVPPALDLIEAPANSVAASEFGLTRALGVDLDVIGRLWSLGDKGQENARNVAKFVARKVGDDWPDSGTREYADRIEELWKPWTACLQSAEPDPAREPDDTDEQWRRKLNAWADSLTYRKLPQVKQLAAALWPYVKIQLAEPVRTDSILFVSQDGDRYQKVPKAAGAVAWSMGVPGVEVGDDRYQPAPGFVRYVPRGIGIVSDGPPSQRSLALDIPTDDAPARLELIAARDASAVVRPLASKALVLMLMQAPENGGWVEAQLDDFTRLCHQHAKRVQIGRDRARIAEVLVEIERLRIVFPDGTHAPLLTVRRPERVADDQTVGWGLTQPAVALTSPGGGAIAGWMLLNFDGIARIPTKRTASLRLYLAAGARWNDAHMASFKNPPLELEEWALRTNSLSQIALDASNKRRSHRLSETKRQIRKEIEYLADEARLASVEKIGNAYRLNPTEAHEEAYRMFRKGAARRKH
jgi:hypothetical protein